MVSGPRESWQGRRPGAGAGSLRQSAPRAACRLRPHPHPHPHPHPMVLSGLTRSLGEENEPQPHSLLASQPWRPPLRHPGKAFVDSWGKGQRGIDLAMAAGVLGLASLSPGG